ncbi:hypothetical protein ACF3NA_01445 [Alkanindiges sp. WGS2144]|uniref:hypothetical protein n=1 Tax=Alkanindiges sp. WGS2144 TaxID=3366808 RepID=UPI003750E85B
MSQQQKNSSPDSLSADQSQVSQHKHSSKTEYQTARANSQEQFAKQLKAEHQQELDTADHRTGNFREFDPELARQQAAKHGDKNS